MGTGSLAGLLDLVKGGPSAPTGIASLFGGNGAPPLPERNEVLNPPGQAAERARGAEIIARGGLFAKPPAHAMDTVQGLDVTGQGPPVKTRSATMSRPPLSLPPMSAPVQPMPGRAPVQSTAPAQTQSSAPAKPSGLFDGVKEAFAPVREAFAPVREAFAPAQANMRAAATDPLMQLGLSLMSSGYDGSNPWTMLAGQLGKIPGYDVAGRETAVKEATGKQAASDNAANQQLNSLIAAMSKNFAGAAQEPDATSRVARGQARLTR